MNERYELVYLLRRAYKSVSNIGLKRRISDVLERVKEKKL
jgi:hypothetical protein